MPLLLPGEAPDVIEHARGKTATDEPSAIERMKSRLSDAIAPTPGTVATYASEGDDRPAPKARRKTTRK